MTNKDLCLIMVGVFNFRGKFKGKFQGEKSMLVYGQLKKADLEHVSIAQRSANPTVGRVVWNTDNERAEIWTGSEWSPLGSDTGSVLPKYATASLPTASENEGLLVYDTTSGSVKIAVGGVYQVVGVDPSDTTSITNSVNQNTQDISDNKTAIEANDTDIADLNTDLAEVSGKVGTNESAITGLASRATTLEDLAGTTEDLDSIDGYYNKDDSFKTAIRTNSDKNKDQDTEIATLNTGLNSVNTTLGGLGDTYATQESVEDNATNITNLHSNAGNLVPIMFQDSLEVPHGHTGKTQSTNASADGDQDYGVLKLDISTDDKGKFVGPVFLNFSVRYLPADLSNDFNPTATSSDLNVWYTVYVNNTGVDANTFGTYRSTSHGSHLIFPSITSAPFNSSNIGDTLRVLAPNGSFFSNLAVNNRPKATIVLQLYGFTNPVKGSTLVGV